MIRTRFVKVRGPGPDARFHDGDVDVVTFFNRGFTGRIGRVVGRSAEGDLAGVGDSPEDPAYAVRFAPGYGMAATVDLFWPEELEPVRLPGWRNPRRPQR